MTSLSKYTRAHFVFSKELASFFGSNLAPITVGIVSFLCGLVSVVLALSQGVTYDDVTRVIFYMFYIVIIAASLFFSMSAFAGERKQGTMELLYTLPVNELDLVIGKFLMGVSFISVIATGITIVYVVGIAEAPWYVAVTGIFGLLLVGCYATSISIFASSLTESYLLALLIAAAIALSIDVGGFLAGLLPSPIKEIFTHMHGLNQYNTFTRGIIPVKSVMFFVSMSALFLYLTVKVLESRRWRG